MSITTQFFACLVGQGIPDCRLPCPTGTAPNVVIKSDFAWHLCVKVTMLASSFRQRCHPKNLRANLPACGQQLPFEQLNQLHLPLLLLFFLLSLPRLIKTQTTLHSQQSSEFTHMLNELYAALQPLATCPPPLILRPVFLGSSACVLPTPPSCPLCQHHCELAGRTLVIGDLPILSLIHSSVYSPSTSTNPMSPFSIFPHPLRTFSFPLPF
jgi:hypothetical protein